jgi:tetratricopeptide (TPR) repeat protein
MSVKLLALAALLTGATALSAAPAGAQQAPSSAADRIAQAARALGNLDFERITTDRAYGEAALGHIQVLLPLVKDKPAEQRRLQGMRALILAEVGRPAEAKALLEQLLAAPPPEPDGYFMVWAAASHLRDPVLMVRAVEGVASTLGNQDPGTLFEALAPEMVFPLDQMLKEQGLLPERIRLAEALVKMGWQRSKPSTLDHFRLRLVQHRLDQGQREEAARLAREISSSDAIVSMLVARRYDGLLPPGEEALGRVLEEEDRGTANALASAPNDAETVLERITYLRSVGKNAEAVAVAQPWLADARRAASVGIEGPYIVNQAAYSLVALGRVGEAVDAMRRLTELDLRAHPEADLIGPGINYAGMLWELGRPADSLAQIERLRPLAAEHANQYGKMWIAAHAACAHAALNQADRAAAELRQLRLTPSINQAAVNQAMLCMGDLDGSERLLIERLSSDDPSEVLLALQDYSIESSGGPGLDLLRKRLREVRERPAVRAAAEKVGHIRRLPLDRTYHGTF